MIPKTTILRRILVTYDFGPDDKLRVGKWKAWIVLS